MQPSRTLCVSIEYTSREKCSAVVEILLRVGNGLGRVSGMNLLAAYFRSKAQLCRELADTLTKHQEPVVSKLRSMASEFDRNADVIEERLLEKMPEKTVEAKNTDLQ